MNPLSTIEQTLLGAATTADDVRPLCEGALAHSFAGVCVNPCHVPLAASMLSGTSCRVVSVLNFPLGAGSEAGLEAEAEWLIAAGVDELDAVVPIGAALARDWPYLRRWLSAVRAVTRGKTLKIILETGYFGPEHLAELAELVARAGVDYLKTSTGFGPRGASLEDVRLLASLARGRARVKASGGIRDLDTALQMLQAGATRLGTSSGLAIVDQLRRASG